MTPKAILLDLDNTLYNADKAYADSLRYLKIDQALYAEARKLVKARLPAGHVCARNRLLYFKCLLEAQGNYTPQALLSLQTRYDESLTSHIQKQWLSLGRKELFESLAARFPLVLVTNENLRTQCVKLAAIDPDGHLFPHLVCSEEFGVEKPSRVLFQRGLDLLKLEASECLFVGDSWEADIVPAGEMGMPVAWSTEFLALSPDGLDGEQSRVRRILSLDELKAL